MGLFGRLKNRPKKKWILADVSFDKDLWDDEIFYLDEFLEDFGDENDEYQMTRQQLIDEDIYSKVYEYTFEGRTVEVKPDGTVLLSLGKYTSDPPRAVGRIHDRQALELLRAGAVFKTVPQITGGNWKQLDLKRTQTGEDPVEFRVELHYKEDPS